MISEEIAIRSIQHYMYCPHRWGLLEIDKAWAENFFVTKANLLHERVHDPEKNYTARGKKVFTAVPVYNDKEGQAKEMLNLAFALATNGDKDDIPLIDGKYVRTPYHKVTLDNIEEYAEKNSPE